MLGFEIVFNFFPSGTIDAWELKETLKAMGQNPTDEEVFQMLSQVRDA